jgi:hypothetical protein
MYEALLILDGIEADGVLGQVLPLEGSLGPRYLPDASWDLTDRKWNEFLEA